MAVLALPVVLPLILGKSPMYLWSDVNQHAGEPGARAQDRHLNPKFFAIRFVFYFGFWTVLSYFFLNRSLGQDEQSADTAKKTVVTMRRVGRSGHDRVRR